MCTAFEIGDNALRRWIHLFDNDGVLGLAPDQRGPEGPSKLIESLAVRISSLSHLECLVDQAVKIKIP